MSVATLANRTVTVYRPTDSVDAIGAPKEVYAFHLRTRGRSQPLSGADAVRLGKPESTVMHKLYIAGTPDIKARDRITIGSLILYVVIVRDIDLAGKFTTIECEQRDA